MRTLAKLRFLSATALALALFNSLSIEIHTGHSNSIWSVWIVPGRAEARSSGGRSRGGSFSRPSSPSRSAPAPSYRNNPAPSYPQPYYPRSVPIPIPAPGYGYGSGYSSGGFSLFPLLLLLGGGSLLPIVWFYFMRSRSFSGKQPDQGYGGSYSGNREIDNDIVTVTRLQVALLSQARSIQDNLTDYTLKADTDTPEGLVALLQESVLALLRSPENWSHVRVNSETVKSREAASQLFEQLSIEERSKFSAETLSNVSGQIRQQTIPKAEDDAPASYIVVTLVLGTADDQPLFNEKIRSTAELQAALKRLGSIPSDYLLVFELLWSPQEATDSLTYDELLTEYPDLVQI